LVLLNYFAGLNYLFSLQDFEFEITYQIWVWHFLSKIQY
jgi:hypothetical protein